MKKLLLTGFGPFAEHRTNPTQALVEYFHNQVIDSYQIIAAILSVEYEKSIEELNILIEQNNPHVIINLGLAADRAEITPELIAINYQHSLTADNSGVIKKFNRINQQGKESFFSTLPLEKMLQHLQKLSIPASLSTTAGTYVCNTVMYQTLKKIQQDKRSCLGGFIHIPANMEQEKLITAITSCIRSLH